MMAVGADLLVSSKPRPSFYIFTWKCLCNTCIFFINSINPNVSWARTWAEKCFEVRCHADKEFLSGWAHQSSQPRLCILNSSTHPHNTPLRQHISKAWPRQSRWFVPHTDCDCWMGSILRRYQSSHVGHSNHSKLKGKTMVATEPQWGSSDYKQIGCPAHTRFIAFTTKAAHKDRSVRFFTLAWGELCRVTSLFVGSFQYQKAQVIKIQMKWVDSNTTVNAGLTLQVIIWAFFLGLGAGSTI